MINREEQKEKTYIELYNLLNVIPYKYSYTRKQIKNLMDLLNCEKYLYTNEEVVKIGRN